MQQALCEMSRPYGGKNKLTVLLVCLDHRTEITPIECKEVVIMM